MTDRPLRRLTSKPALRAEEVDAIIERFRVDMSDVAGELAAATAPKVEDSKDVRAGLPSLSANYDAVLREWLEEETIALVEPEGPQGINAYEFHHELLKKVLVGLKREVLQEIVREHKLVPESKLDELVRQVARAYDWDEAAITRLVIDYTEEPRETSGGLSTRVFFLKDPADLGRMASRLDYVDGRYYRTGIARWFVFNQYRRVGSTLRVDGTLQSYKATVDSREEDKLATKSDFSACELEVHDGSTTVLIHQARTYGTAKAMLAALRVATAAEAKDYVPNTGVEAPASPRKIHPSTLFLLDLLTHRMRGPLFRMRNPIVAKFRLGARAEGTDALAASRKPTLRAVRFEGDNLLDSTPACGLMWTEGRPLVDVTLSVAATKSEADATIRGRVPVRVALERDAVLVETGLTADAQVISDVHRALVAHVEAAIHEAVSSERAAQIERPIKAQAESPDPDADAQLLDDQSDADA